MRVAIMAAHITAHSELVNVVVSGVAPMTESECSHVDVAAARTDFVIGVVSKVDAHRGWRDPA